MEAFLSHILWGPGKTKQKAMYHCVHFFVHTLGHQGPDPNAKPRDHLFPLLRSFLYNGQSFSGTFSTKCLNIKNQRVEYLKKWGEEVRGSLRLSCLSLEKCVTP